MEGVTGLKRGRDEALDGVTDDSISKRLCEGSGSSGLLVLEAEPEEVPSAGSLLDAPCLSSTAKLSPEIIHYAGGDSVGADSKSAVEETLRSLEEELGVSDESAEYAIIPPASVDELASSELANWSEDIWNVHGFSNQGEDIAIGVGVGCSSGSSPTVSGSLSSRDSSVLVDGGLSDTTARPGGADRSDRFGAVDIGFLLEASDDELGIPPSPNSQREQSSERDPIIQEGSLDLAGVDTLHEAVSLALEGGGDNMGLSDSAIDEWMMGNLDFMMENPATYPSVSPLVEAGLVL